MGKRERGEESLWYEEEDTWYEEEDTWSYNAYPWGLGMSRGDGGCYGHAYIEGELRYCISGEFET